MKFDLYAQALLLNSSHTCGEGLPHAGGSSQGELGAALQTCNGARQYGGPTGPAHEQAADILPAATKKKKKRKIPCIQAKLSLLVEHITAQGTISYNAMFKILARKGFFFHS